MRGLRPAAARSPASAGVRAGRGGRPRDDPTDALAAAVAASSPASATWPWPPTPAGRAALWRYREDHTRPSTPLGPPHKLDVTLPLAALAAFIAEVPGAWSRPCSRPPGPGCSATSATATSTSTSTGVAPDDDRGRRRGADRSWPRWAAASAPSTASARPRRRWLPPQPHAAELAAMPPIKRALDPDGVLNPTRCCPRRNDTLPNRPPSRTGRASGCLATTCRSIRVVRDDQGARSSMGILPSVRS